MQQNQKLMQKLIVGSQNLDRMEKEIEMIVSMLIGMIIQERAFTGTKIEFSQIFESDGFCVPSQPNEVLIWRFHEEMVGGGGRYQILISLSSPRSNALPVCRFQRDEIAGVNMQSTQMIHEALPYLVSLLFDTFRFLKEECTPLFRAADVKF